MSEALSPSRIASVSRSRIGIAAVVVALVVSMLWPVAVNRGVFIFPDTTAYIRGADAAVVKLTGVRTDWSDQLFSRYSDTVQEKNATSAAKPPSVESGREVVLAGRSVYYGMFLFASDAIGGFGLTAVLQALLTTAAMILAIRRVRGHLDAKSLLPFLLLPLVTSVAFYVGFMMPDLLTPLAILGTAMTALYWQAMTRGERVFWIALLVFALCSHSANLLIIGGLFVVMCATRLVTRARGLTLAPAAGVLVAAIFAELLFAAGVAKATGFAPVRPPFVSARLIDDGPGHDFLFEACAKGKPFALCDYLDRMPALSDEMLWSHSPVGGIFSAVSADEKRRIAADEVPFLFAVVTDRPVDVIASTVRSVGRQVGELGLMEFRSRHTNPEKLPPRVRDAYVSSQAVAGGFDVRLPEQLMLASFLASAALVLFVLVRRVKSGLLDDDGRLALLVAAGLAFNIVVSGALSTPHERYQARASWLLPFVALLLAPTAVRRRTPADVERDTAIAGRPATQS